MLSRWLRLGEPEFESWRGRHGPLGRQYRQPDRPAGGPEVAGRDRSDSQRARVEFWHETPGAIRLTGILYSDPRGALWKWQGEIGAILSEPEFEFWHETPGAIRDAVIKNPTDPRCAAEVAGRDRSDSQRARVRVVA